MPVKDCYKVEPDAIASNIRDIRTPYLVGKENLLFPEQIREHRMMRMRDTRVWVGKQGTQAHFSHKALDCFVVDDNSLPVQFFGNFRRSIKWQFGVDLVNLSHEQQVSFGYRYRLVVVSAAAYAQKLALADDWEIWMLGFNERKLF